MCRSKKLTGRRRYSVWIVDIMKDYKSLPPDEQKHFIECSCGQMIDMRDLGEVFEHLHEYNVPTLNTSASYSVRIGEALAYRSDGSSIHLS